MITMLLTVIVVVESDELNTTLPPHVPRLKTWACKWNQTDLT